MTKAKPFVLVLRTCDANMQSYGHFQWPEKGPVAASDWDGAEGCGGGLHGLLWGEGDGSLLNWSEDAKWVVVKVDPANMVGPFRGKVKFAKGSVVFCGTRDGALDYLDRHGAADKAVTATTRTAGDYGTATAGYGGTATAGDRGTATAGDYGTATAGDDGTATAGYGGTATAGDYGTATAGDYGTLAIKWWDDSKSRYRIAYGYPGEKGIEANVLYRVEGRGKLVKVNV